MRVKYIKASIDTIVARINNQESLQAMRQKLQNSKLSELWGKIWEEVIADPPPQLDFAALEQRNHLGPSNIEKIEGLNGKPNEEEVEQMIRSIMDTLPHLGDGKYCVLFTN